MHASYPALSSAFTPLCSSRARFQLTTRWFLSITNCGMGDPSTIPRSLCSLSRITCSRSLISSVLGVEFLLRRGDLFIGILQCLLCLLLLSDVPAYRLVFDNMAVAVKDCRSLHRCHRIEPSGIMIRCSMLSTGRIGDKDAKNSFTRAWSSTGIFGRYRGPRISSRFRLK